MEKNYEREIPMVHVRSDVRMYRKGHARLEQTVTVTRSHIELAQQTAKAGAKVVQIPVAIRLDARGLDAKHLLTIAADCSDEQARAVCEIPEGIFVIAVPISVTFEGVTDNDAKEAYMDGVIQDDLEDMRNEENMEDHNDE